MMAKMAEATLNGTKTQTRRIIDPQPHANARTWMLSREFNDRGSFVSRNLVPLEVGTCRYGGRGDQLLVGEMHRVERAKAGCYLLRYKTDSATLTAPIEKVRKLWRDRIFPERWCAGRYLPTWAVRMRLEITELLAERLQDISYEDIKAEGWPGERPLMSDEVNRDAARDWFMELLDEINGLGTWERNPWVWVITFKKLA
jgi:hypothetical protein